MSGMNKKLIALDSNVFIYHFEQNPQYSLYTHKIFTKLIKGTISGITSIISAVETLSFPISKDLEKNIIEGFSTLPNFKILDVSFEIGIEAARIRRENKFRLPDAIQLATAIKGKAEIFITNDIRLKNFKEIKIILLTDF